MGSWGRENLQKGGGWQTQRGGGLWSGAGQAAASRLHKVVAGRPSKLTDCEAGQARLQLAGKAAAGGPGNRPCNPEFQREEIKPQTTD